MSIVKDVSLLWMTLCVGAGGGLGAVLRWWLSCWLNARWGAMPLGTLVCNWAGGFAIGLLAAWFAAHPALSSAWRLFLITGLLGGLTTFSTFSLESVELLMAGEPLRALWHVAMHLVGSIALAALGWGVARWVFGW